MPNDDDNKPVLTMLDAQSMTADNLEAMYRKLTGKDFTPEERREAEQAEALYTADRKPANEPDSPQ